MHTDDLLLSEFFRSIKTGNLSTQTVTPPPNGSLSLYYCVKSKSHRISGKIYREREKRQTKKKREREVKKETTEKKDLPNKTERAPLISKFGTATQTEYYLLVQGY